VYFLLEKSRGPWPAARRTEKVPGNSQCRYALGFAVHHQRRKLIDGDLANGSRTGSAEAGLLCRLVDHPIEIAEECDGIVVIGITRAE
jgi:hypothetical protein